MLRNRFTAGFEIRQLVPAAYRCLPWQTCLYLGPPDISCCPALPRLQDERFVRRCFFTANVL